MDPKPSFKIPLLLQKRRKRYIDNISFGQDNPSNVMNISLPLIGTEKSLVKSKTLKQNVPALGMKLNLGYRMEYFLSESEMKSRFPNHYASSSQFLITDKTFFKRKDAISEYGEVMLRQKLNSKKPESGAKESK